MAGGRKENPFRIHGVVTRQFFTDRAGELRRIQATLAEPGAKLVVYGPRRMGKTSAIAQAVLREKRKGGQAFLADLSTVSTPVDMANRILEAAAEELGRKWRDLATEIVQRIGIALTLTPQPGSGLIVPRLDVNLRSHSIEDQQQSLTRTLDSIDALAASKRVHLGIALDEFQEIHRLGGEAAEWSLRGAIQHHTHLSYVLAGSNTRLIADMLSKGRALYGLADQLEIGPIAPEHLSKWIDDRWRAAGLAVAGVGERCIELAGPRTRDVVQLARQCFAVGAPRKKAQPSDVDAALDQVVAEQDAPIRAAWSALTANQQNVLRAIAFNRAGLTMRETLDLFALPSSGSAANTASALIAAGMIERGDSRSGYVFDSPFVRRWVVINTLADLGLPPS